MELCRSVPRDKVDYFVNQVLSYTRRVASMLLQMTSFDLVINLNESVHHDIKGAVMRQFVVGEYVSLSHGNLMLQDVLKLAKKLADMLTKTTGRIAVVLTGHQLLQTLCLSVTVAVLGQAYALAWLVGESRYVVERIEKQRIRYSLNPKEVDSDVIIVPTYASSKMLSKLQSLGEYEIRIVSYDIKDEESWRMALVQSLEFALGQEIPRIWIECPGGIPAVIVAHLVEGLQENVEIFFSFQTNHVYSMKISHRNLRTLTFDCISRII